MAASMVAAITAGVPAWKPQATLAELTYANSGSSSPGRRAPKDSPTSALRSIAEVATSGFPFVGRTHARETDAFGQCFCRVRLIHRLQCHAIARTQLRDHGHVGADHDVRHPVASRGLMFAQQNDGLAIVADLHATVGDAERQRIPAAFPHNRISPQAYALTIALRRQRKRDTQHLVRISEVAGVRSRDHAQHRVVAPRGELAGRYVSRLQRLALFGALEREAVACSERPALQPAETGCDVRARTAQNPAPTNAAGERDVVAHARARRSHLHAVARPQRNGLPQQDSVVVD